MFAILFIALLSPAQPAARSHKVIQASGVRLTPANKKIKTTSTVNLRTDNKYRYIESNGVPRHKIGAFPNSGNPNPVAAQSYQFRVSLNPRKNKRPTWITLPMNFGVAMNGVPFDPGAAEWYLGKRDSQWQYEALSGAVSLGIDANHAHVQPNGAYHYHGLPTGLLTRLKLKRGQASPLVGWAADGFPIYALYGPDGKNIISSYRLKTGERPSRNNQPGGSYDGTFVADYEYVSALSPLDRCNGMRVKTKEYPQGTYAYFLTNKFPVVPRCFVGSPDESFKKQKRTDGPTHAAGEGGHGHGPPPGFKAVGAGPPPAAFKACKGKRAKASCSFERRPGKSARGICFVPHGHRKLVCRPNGID